MAAISPKGYLLTKDNLPSEDRVRWTATVKAEIVIAVKNDIITRDEALEKYRIGEEEFSRWVLVYEAAQKKPEGYKALGALTSPRFLSGKKSLLDRLNYIIDAPTGVDFGVRKGHLTRHDIRQIIVAMSPSEEE